MLSVPAEQGTSLHLQGQVATASVSACAALGSVLPMSVTGRLGQGKYVLRSSQAQHWKRHAVGSFTQTQNQAKKEQVSLLNKRLT